MLSVKRDSLKVLVERLENQLEIHAVESISKVRLSDWNGVEA